MSKRDASFYFVDIFLAIYKINLYTQRFDNAQDFLDSMLEWDATIRELEIIGEAINWLIKLNILENKKYRKIVDFRNLVIHGYFGIDENDVWDVVKNKLSPLMEDLTNIIIEQNISIKNAVHFAKKENYKNEKIIDFLDTILKSIQRR